MARIFKSVEEKICFFEEGIEGAISEIITKAAGIIGKGCELVKSPTEKTKTVKCIGEVQVASIDDSASYTIEKVNKSEVVKEKPYGDLAVQSVLIDNKIHTEKQAEKIIKENDFNNYGVEVTDNYFIFKQYELENFSGGFKIQTIKNGVACVYGHPGKSEDIKEKFKKSLEKYDAVRNLNSTLFKDIKIFKDRKINKDETEEEHFILGIVLEPTDGGETGEMKPDTQNDVYSAKEVRKAAHNWMENHGHIDLSHSWEPLIKGTVSILENSIAPADFVMGEDDYVVAKGTWLLGLRVNDQDLWEATEKDGSFGAFSIGGYSDRVPVGTEGTE